MGKASFIGIAAMALLTTSLSVSAITSAMVTSDAKGRDQQSLLAEEIARSGLDMTISRVSREFDTWRDGYPETAYGGGTFETTAEGPAAGPVRVHAVGQVDEVDIQLTAWLARLASAAAAYSVSSDSMAVQLSGNAVVSGIDHDVDDGEGYGRADATRGVWVTSANAGNAFASALGSSADRVRGLAAAADVQQSALAGEHAGFLAQAATYATDSYASDQSFTNRTFGSDAAPAVVVVDGDASFVNGGGVGLLYVKGDFSASGTFLWRGVVVTEGEGDLSFSMTGQAAIYGAAYTLHAEGEIVPGPTTPYPSLGDFPSIRGYGSETATVSWPGLGTVEVEVDFDTDASRTYSTARAEGISLQSFIGRADLDGVNLGATGISAGVEYTGPTEMPMLDVRPAVTSYHSETDVTLEFSTDLPDGPLYLYVADLDWAPMTIRAYDAYGNRLSTRSWDKSLSVDLILPDDGKRTRLSTGASSATLTPLGSQDGEIIIDEITIPDASQIRRLRFSWDSAPGQGDVAGIALSTESLYSAGGLLDVKLTGNATIRYASNEIGRLASVLPTVEDRAWIETYDFRMDAEVDRMTLQRRAGATDATGSTGGSGGTDGSPTGEGTSGGSGDSGDSGASGSSGSSGDSGPSGDPGNGGDGSGNSGSSGGSDDGQSGRSGSSGDDGSSDDAGDDTEEEANEYDYYYCRNGTTYGTNSWMSHAWALFFGADDGRCE